MKHNLLKSLIISVILLTGVSNAWGYTISSAKVYYDDSNSQWSNNVVIAFDKGYKDNNSKAGGAVFAMTKIDNTSLYYWSGTWGDEVVSYMRFGKATQTYNWYEWGDYAKSTWDLSTHDSWDGVSNGWGLDINNASVLFGATSADKGADLTKTDLSGYSALNSIQTIKTAVDGADANSKATISITSYKMTGDGSATEQTASITSGAKSTTISAARTATTTLTVGTVAIGYKFDGWYMAATGGTALSTSTTYTYYPTAATTIYARFSAQPSTTIYLEPTGYWNSHNPQYVAHVWKNSVNEDIIMTGVGDSPYRYYKAEVPYGYTDVVFYRKSTDGTTIWNQTADLQLPTNDNVLYTITSTGTNNSGQQDYQAAGGNWKVANLVYTVTLEATSNGSFQVTCNGETKTEGEAFENVAAGTQLTITKIKPHNDGYDQTMVYSTDGYTEFDTYEVDNQGNRTYTYTVNSDVTIAEDFRTKEAHTIYIKVTSIPYETWCKDSNGEHKSPRIIYINGLTQQKLHDSENLVDFEHVSSNSSYSIYRCTIPKGNHSFKLFPCNSFSENVYDGEVFHYQIIPNDPSRNCFEFENKEENNTPSGEWVASKVYLDPCKYGTYGIRCNGQEYYNYADNQRIVELPFGAVLEPIDAISTSPHYGPNPRYASSIVINEYFEVDLNKSLTLIDQIRYSANLVTTQPHRVILHIPDNILSDWNADVPYNCVYAKDYRSYGSCKFDEASQTYIGKLIEGTKLGSEEYYYFDIPAGFNNFVFERKTSLGEGVGPHRATNDFLYQIPLDENLVYTLTGTDSSGKSIGTWGPLPEYTITLGYPDIGRFGIIVDGETIYASNQNKRDTYITVPYGTEVQLLKGEPGDTAYTTNLVKVINNVKEYIIFGKSENQRTFTITSNVKFDDIFATKPNQTVFIAVPKNHGNLGKWYTCSNADHKFGHDVYVWQTKFPYDYQQDGQDKQTMQKKVAKIETNDYTYYQYTLDDHVYELNFQFKSIDANGTWDRQAAHAGTISSKCPPISTKNCFYLDGGINKKDGNDNHENGYTGYWGYGPPCKVIMTFTNIGRYGFKDCFGNVHYRSPNSKETEFSVPWGSQVEVLEGEPGNDTFTGTVGMLSEDEKTVVERFHDGVNKDNFVTITRNTTFDDLFATKEEHVVYLGIPNEGFDDWYINNSDKMFAWIKEPYNDLGLREIQPTFVIDDITYYQYTLPAGIFEFAFQRKTGNNIDDPICETRLFTFELPVTDYNCFILEGEGVRNHKDKNYLTYDGYWTKLPAKPENEYDYRVLYAEKELIKTHEEGETEDWETAFRTVYEHPSDIIPKGEASKTISLHINTSQKRGDKTVHPMVILQQFQQMPESNTYKWVNLQAHTVLPLKATGNMGMLPGRKKAFGDLPFYDDGIEAIKNDTTYSSRLDGLYKGSGVWNFTVTQGVSQSSTTVTLNVGNTTRYTGKYYIRTEALTNGWDDYTDNLMTYSDYADYNSGFSHYFCKWLLVGNNVKFTIANDYAQSISDPLYGDATDLWGKPINYQMVERDQVLNQDANVRFAWYEMNNFVHRAYLGGSTHVHDRFLVVKGDEGKIFSHYVGDGLPAQGDPLPEGADFTPRYGLYANEEIFRDDANWIYHADIQIKPGCIANVTAQHYGKTQTFIKERTLVYGDDLGNMKNQYPVRLLYDFKINRLITGYIPNGNNNTEIEAFTTNLMLIRKHHEQATQLLFNSNAKTTQGAYGVMTFERDFLRDPLKTNKERAAYFISFPFDVKISDVFGFGQFYKHWFIQYYDGEARAKNGLWADTDTYWKHITDPNTVLEAHKGYALLFSLSNIEKSGVLDASKEISLYFPSTNNNIGNITDANPEVTVDVPAHICTIEREYRKFKDSNWNLIGVPAYADVSGFVNKTFKDPYNNEVYFYWKRDVAEDTYEVWDAKKGSSLTFQTMHAYMLQYAGVINWKAHTMSEHDYSNKLIARRNTEQEASHTLRITLNQADKKLDQTYVRLQEEDATADFDMNKDQYKIKKAKANIYSLIQNAVGQIEAGANVLPLQTTVVPLGVIIKTAGEYTFSMPDGTDGIIAELIDYQTNTRTNLLLDNYTVTLPAGTNNSRFALSLQPDKTVTSVDNIGNEATGDKVKKYLIDGVLYMQKDGALYDAQGRCVQ